MTAQPKGRGMVAAASILVALAVTIPVFADDPAQRERDVHSAAADAEAPFLAENDAAMTKMMSDMAVKPTGDVDRDFVAMMVPHHQGAVDMAKAELKYGHNEQLRRLAQEIVVTQQQEITAMRLALGEPLPPSVASPTQPGEASASQPSAMTPPMSSHGKMSQHSMNMK